MSKGAFITFEGIEASGKTTQIQRLAEILRADGHDVIVTREPGGTEAGVKIRQLLLNPTSEKIDPLAELLLFEADRADHVAKVLRPALEQGQVILSDRYCDASTAYQGAARGVEPDLVLQLNALATGGLQPDRTFLLDVSPDVTGERIKKRIEIEGLDESRFDLERLEFHRAVRASYLEIAELEPKRWRVIDASRPEDDIADDILRMTREALDV